jgi:NADP-dependent 3-hydroxy acid dehydrogenase YdfG
MFSIQNKVIAITGASSGIGRALAADAIGRGAKVAVCARNQEKLQQAFAGLPQDNILLVAADVSKEEDCKAFVEKIQQKWGRVDVLVNNAGITMRALFEDVDINMHCHPSGRIKVWL